MLPPPWCYTFLCCWLGSLRRTRAGVAGCGDERSDGLGRVEKGLTSLSSGLEEGEGMLWGELLAVGAEARGLGRKALAIGCG